jgi:hypothetical protein
MKCTCGFRRTSRTSLPHDGHGVSKRTTGPMTMCKCTAKVQSSTKFDQSLGTGLSLRQSSATRWSPCRSPTTMPSRRGHQTDVRRSGRWNCPEFHPPALMMHPLQLSPETIGRGFQHTDASAEHSHAADRPSGVFMKRSQASLGPTTGTARRRSLYAKIGQLNVENGS